MKLRGSGAALALVFGTVFFVMGLHLPYWPVWLAARGLSPGEVGLVLSLGPWMRVIANPIAGRIADRTGRPRRLGQCLAIGVVVAYVLFGFADGFATLVVLSLFLGLAYSPLIPLTDTIAMQSVGAQGGYGRVRRWGSLSFIAASIAGGALLARGSENAILWGLLGASGVLALSMILLPKRAATKTSLHEVYTPSERPVSMRRLRGFLLTALVLHATHAVLYGFGTAHWRTMGIEDGTIGWLWSVGVLAEIALFSAGATLARKMAPARLLALAGAGGVVRWSVLASTSALVPLLLAQLLHALTFAALHLGALEFIRRQISDKDAAHATGLYSAASGVALGIGLPASGWLYGIWQGQAFLAMAVLSTVGAIAALRLAPTSRA